MVHMRTKRPLREPVREAPGPNPKNYITPAGLQRLKDQHRFLMNRERPAVTKVVAWAASNGDRSENADYLYSKRRLRQTAPCSRESAVACRVLVDADLPMDFADAALVCAAERSGVTHILTFDHHFTVYRLPRRARFTVLP